MRRTAKKLAKQFGNKTFVITGAAGGLGREMARLLAPHWAGALLLDVNEEGLNNLAEELRTDQRLVVTRVVDLTSDQDIATMSDLPAEYSPPDVLINNAGISFMSLAEKQPLDEYRRMMEVNYFAVVALINRFLPAMLERRSGQLITIASGSGVLANYGGAGYCGSKFAVVGYMESLRQELAGTGVTSNCVLLPTVMTDFHRRVLEGEFADMAKGLPTIEPEEAARRLLLQAAAGKEVISFGSSVEAGLLLNRLAPSIFRTAMTVNGYVLNRRRGRV
jgi:short-subunit dehydrogenase